MFQTFNLLATMSAFENVELPMTILGKLSARERKKRATELLTRTSHLPFSIVSSPFCGTSPVHVFVLVVGLQDRLGHLVRELIPHLLNLWLISNAHS